MNLSRYLEEFRDTLQSLAAQRVRAMLTLLGIILGVGTLVFLATLVNGAGAFLRYGVQTASGNDMLSVRAKWTHKGRVRNLDVVDARSLDRAMTPDGALVLGRFVTSIPFGTGFGNRVYAVGTRPEAQAMYDLQVAQGRFLAQADIFSQTPVAVMGAQALGNLMPGEAEPLGKEVKLKGHRFKVVGVLKTKPSQNKGFMWTWNTSVIVPEPVYKEKLAGNNNVDEIVVKAPSELVARGNLDTLVTKVQAVLALRHPNLSEFEVQDPNKENGFESVLGLVVMGLELAIAAVCLGVGGINIMNILMVTVAQRRREIGLRRALGATKGSIERQFLIEAGVLAAIGGVAGIAVGLFLALLASLLFTQLWGHWPFLPAYLEMGLGLAAAIGTGLVFGWYPAKQAADLKPIDCLRAD